MTTITSCSPPPEVIASGAVRDGYWMRFDDDGRHAHALMWWKGGPKSPDRDVVLHWIESHPQREGYGTELVKQICYWADHASRRLTISCLCVPDLVGWYSRLGFISIEPRYGSVVMKRTPKLIVPQ